LVLLGLITGMVRQYSRVDRATQFGERARIEYSTTLTDLLKEAQDAYSLTQPDSTTVVTTIEFDRVDPRTEGTRLPLPPEPPAPLPLNWEPFPVSSRLQVRYFKLGEDLIRYAAHPRGAESRTTITDGISAFSTSLEPNNVLSVTLETQSDGKVETISRRVVLPCL
jgi:hypothetical protein